MAQRKVSTLLFIKDDSTSAEVKGIEHLQAFIAGLAGKSNEVVYKMCKGVLATVEGGKDSNFPDMESFKNEIGKVIAPLNEGKAVDWRMVDHFAKIAERIDLDSIKKFGDAGATKGLRFIAARKGLSRTMRNEIVVALGQSGGAYSDKDLQELAKYAGLNPTLSADTITTNCPAGFAKKFTVSKEGDLIPIDTDADQVLSASQISMEMIKAVHLAHFGEECRNNEQAKNTLADVIIPGFLAHGFAAAK